MPINIALYSPQIPPNTGNIIRLCANNGACLHLIKPYGFYLDEKSLRRAGLDYHDLANIYEYDSLDDYLQKNIQHRIYAITKFGKTRYDVPNYQQNDHLLFGSETSGLPNNFIENYSPSYKIYIPMVDGNRSLNLSNAVSIVSYEAWKKCYFHDSAISQFK